MSERETNIIEQKPSLKRRVLAAAGSVALVATGVLAAYKTSEKIEVKQTPVNAEGIPCSPMDDGCVPDSSGVLPTLPDKQSSTTPESTTSTTGVSTTTSTTEATTTTEPTTSTTEATTTTVVVTTTGSTSIPIPPTTIEDFTPPTTVVDTAPPAKPEAPYVG